MGLGKTIQVIAFLSYLKHLDKLAPSLIVVLRTLMDNWQKEMLSLLLQWLARFIFIEDQNV
ncbi:SNF2-related protein [Halalkalibacter flavus]|uniref:SNF2-related protein n=1 Tax=Halalkalibacter flavus TaxID=3090668 RepID=UPI003D674640